MGLETYLKELTGNLKRFQEQKILCDTVLVADDREIWAHSVVLAAGSPFICATLMELGDVDAGVRYSVGLPGCIGAAVEVALQFLYTGQLVMPAAFQSSEEFKRVLHVFKELGIELSKLNGTRVTFKTDIASPSQVHLSKIVNADGDSESDHINNVLYGIADAEKVTEAALKSDCGRRIKPEFVIESDVTKHTLTNTAGMPHPLSDLVLQQTQCKVECNEELSQLFSSSIDDGSQALLNLEEISDPSCLETFETVKAPLKSRRPVPANKPSSSEAEPRRFKTSAESNTRDSLYVGIPDEGWHRLARARPDELMCHCRTCGKLFKGVQSLTIHERAHSTRKVYRCPTCGKQFQRLTCYRKHIAGHQNRSHVCDKCGKVFPTATGLKVHEQRHVDGFPHVCDVCGKAYKFKRYLVVHKMSHSAIKPYLCDTCGRGFCVSTILKRHVLMYHLKQRPFVCAICGKGFVTQGRLKAHAETHTGEKLHGCEVCGMSFNNMGNLKRHQLVHTGEKRHSCNVCGKAFAQKVTLQSHLLVHDTQKSSFVCPTCGKSLSKLAYLKKHSLMHGEQSAHACDVCGKAFTTREYLVRHRAVHGEKRYGCTVCNKGFRNKRLLDAHAKSHSEAYCGVCGKAFFGIRALNTHMRIHTGEEPFVCAVCSQNFGNVNQLKTHMKSHDLLIDSF